MTSSFLMGGLGNQMFQIAAATSLAIDNNDEAIFNFNACYTPLQGNPSNKYKDTLFKNIKKSDVLYYDYIHEEKSHKYEPIQYKKNILLKGYFQSEKYFVNNKKTIINLFNIEEKTENFLYEKYNFSNYKYVSVHIRRGDYLKFSNIHPTCSIDYYLKAMQHFDNYKFLFVSDDIAWVKENFKNNNYIFSEETDEINDLILLTLCDHNIIANSTFSWWGAYLNKKSDKIIIRPNKFFGNDGPKDENDICPDEWIKI